MSHPWMLKQMLCKNHNKLMTRRFSTGIAMALILSGCASSGDLETARQAQIAHDPAAMLRIADAAEQSGDPAGAMAFYRHAAELQPDSGPAQIGIARALTEQGSVDEAIDELRAAHARAPSDVQISATLGRLLVAAHRPADALAVFRDGLRQEPQSMPLLIGQGVALDATGQHDEAQKSYRQVLQLDPDSAPARKDLSLSLALSGKPGGGTMRHAARSGSIKPTKDPAS